MAESEPYRPLKKAIGSSYLIDQRAGAEQMGGCEITLQYPLGETGTIRVSNTLRGSQEPRDDIDIYAAEARKGVLEYATEHQIDLAAFDITLSQFVIHDVDSRPFLYYLAGRNALQSAIAAWKPPSQVDVATEKGS